MDKRGLYFCQRSELKHFFTMETIHALRLLFLYVYIYLHIYMSVCVCVCACSIVVVAVTSSLLVHLIAHRTCACGPNTKLASLR